MKKSPLLFIAFTWLLMLQLAAQPAPSRGYIKEISFTSENDAFLFKKADAYYTNGFFIKKTQVKNKNNKKQLPFFELGQLIFTPLNKKTVLESDIDRPFCGYLFLKAGKSIFYEDGGMLEYDFSAGVIGPASFGEEVQDSYHKLLKYARFSGWQYQISNAVGMDAHTSYAKTVIDENNWFRLVPIGEALVGTTFLEGRLGAYACLGRLTTNKNSALWNARLQTNAEKPTNKSECFFYWYPQWVYQAYNATVQGGMFAQNGSAVLGKVNPWLFQQAWGLCFAKSRFTTKLAIIYQTREAVSQIKDQRFGSIQVSYRMH